MADEAPAVSGTLGVFEGLRFGAAIRRRILGSARYAVFVLVAAIAALAFASTQIDLALADDGPFGFLADVAPYLVAFVACAYVYWRFIMSRWRRNWLARGLPAELAVSYTVAPDGLHIASALSLTIVFWPALSEVGLEKDYWLVFGGGAMAYFLPRRFFASPADERAFLAAVLGRLSPPARARSRDVAAFLAEAS